MDTFTTVHSAGLPTKDALVYAALLDVGQQSIAALSRTTGLHRPALYTVLPRLERKGLVSRIKVKNRVHFAAESPTRLLEAYQREVAQATTELETLATTYTTSRPERPRLRFTEGTSAVLRAFDDVIDTLPIGGTFYRYSARTITPTVGFTETRYAKNRDQRRIERLVITSEAKARTKQPKLERSVRSVPKEFDLFADNVSLLLYGDKTAYIDYNTNTVCVIESETIARFQEKIFRLLWQRLSNR